MLSTHLILQQHHELGQYFYLLNFIDDKVEAQGGKVTYQSFPAGKWWNWDSNLSHPTLESVISITTSYWLSIIYQCYTWICYIFLQQTWQESLYI